VKHHDHRKPRAYSRQGYCAITWPFEKAVSLLRCLPSGSRHSAGHADFVVPGYTVSGVVDKADENRYIATDKAFFTTDDPILREAIPACDQAIFLWV
jgi:hypothetical protein